MSNPFPAAHRLMPVSAPKLLIFPGLYDVVDNVSEWCWDWYGPYTACDQADSDSPPTGDYRVLRGSVPSTGTACSGSAAAPTSYPGRR